MCLSRVGQIVFGALALAAAALILASMFTKGWKEFRATVQTAGGLQQTVLNVGVPFDNRPTLFIVMGVMAGLS